MLNEFKKFALRGNSLDLAVGIILGAGFGRVVNSLVEDILMPPIGLLLGRVDFRSLYLTLGGGGYSSRAEAIDAGAPLLNYGVFLSTLVDFALLAVAVFLIVRAANRLQPERTTPPASEPCPFCRTSIPSAATRCPACTSKLPAGWEAAIPGAGRAASNRAGPAGPSRRR